MLRHILNNNIKSLNDTESYVLEYVTKTPIDWFFDHMASDNEVREVLYNSFVAHFGYAPKDGIHPFYKVWEKIVKGANIDALIAQTDLYGNSYKMLAEQINELYMSEYRSCINIILKAFAERDYTEIADKHNFGNEITKEKFVEDFEGYSELIVNNLDEQDLETIILFCGKQPNLYHT